MRWRVILAFDFEVTKDNAFCSVRHISLMQLEFNKDMRLSGIENSNRISLPDVLGRLILVFENI